MLRFLNIVLFFVAFLLLLLVSVSLPVTKSITYFSLTGNAEVSAINTGVSGGVMFGNWGWCTTPIVTEYVYSPLITFVFLTLACPLESSGFHTRIPENAVTLKLDGPLTKDSSTCCTLRRSTFFESVFTLSPQSPTRTGRRC